MHNRLTLLAISLLLFSLGACQMATDPTPEPTLSAISQQIATAVTTATATKTPTAIPPTETAIPTHTAVPTHTPTMTPAPTDTPSPTPTPQPGDLIFSDTFSGSASRVNWKLWADSDYRFSIEQGKLLAGGRDRDTYAWSKSEPSFSELDLQIEATITKGSEQAFFGLAFHIDANGDDEIGCLIQGDDMGYCYWMIDGMIEFGDWVQVNVAPASVPNELRLVAIDGVWAFHVNGDCVGQGQYDAKAGRIGLAVSTNLDDVPAQIAYDNLFVRRPDTESNTFLNCVSQPPPTPPTPLSPPPPTGNGTMVVSSHDARAICRVEFWGPARFHIDVGFGETKSNETIPGQYGWAAFIGGTQTEQTELADLRAGGRCSFVCEETHISWGCD